MQEYPALCEIHTEHSSTRVITNWPKKEQIHRTTTPSLTPIYKQIKASIMAFKVACLQEFLKLAVPSVIYTFYLSRPFLSPPLGESYCVLTFPLPLFDPLMHSNDGATSEDRMLETSWAAPLECRIWELSRGWPKIQPEGNQHPAMSFVCGLTVFFIIATQKSPGHIGRENTIW